MGITPGMAQAGLQTALGAGQMIAGMVQNRQANKLREQIPMEDYQQSLILQQLQDRQKAMELGTDAVTVANRGLLREGIQSGYNALRRGAGGDVSTLLSGVSSMNRMYGRNVAQLAAQQAAARENLSQRLEGLTGQMAQRRLSLQMQAYLQKLAQAKQLKTYGMQNLTTGIAGGINSVTGNMQGGLGELIAGALNKKGNNYVPPTVGSTIGTPEEFSDVPIGPR